MKAALSLLAVSVGCLGADANTAADLFARALGQGDLATMETLLSSGFDPNLSYGRDGMTPLNFAMQLGQTRAVELLLAWHADPNARLISRLPETPLQFAVNSGNQRMASILIAGGARIDAKGSNGRTALHLAVVGGRLDLVHFLIEKGSDVNTRDAEGASPLDDTVWQGSIDAVAILLAHGARLNEPNSQTGATPLNEAAYRGNTAIVRYLLQFRPDPGIMDNRGFGPLDNAIRMGKEDCALLLLDVAEAPVYAKAMGTAAAKDESVVVEDLLRRGVSANGALPSGPTALETAASAGAVKTVRVLLDHDADPNVGSPLESASLKGFGAIAGLLLDHGARVNQVNSGSGTTALYAAASFGKADVVKLLLDRGADAGLCGRNRKSAYQAAVENGYREVAAVIQNHGGALGCR